jgi:hypothetical protein
VDSGIPVIVGLVGKSNIGHAVVATGQVLTAHPRQSPLPAKPTWAEFCEAFYVNDDQRGVNLRMSVLPSSAVKETPYTLVDNHFLLIPLPEKVFVPAENAEQLAWDVLKEYVGAWPVFQQTNASAMGSSVDLGNQFVSRFLGNEVIARTYLTYGWKYQYRAIRNLLTEQMRQIARSTELPRFVWVTEFGTVDSIGHNSMTDRRIFSHCVVDATAKNMGADCRLIFHAPGIGMRQVHNPSDSLGAYKKDLFAMKDDRPYYPKLRGNADFGGF